jgi:hypothetical protein
MGPEFGLSITLLAYRAEEARKQAGSQALYQGLRPVRPGRLSRSGGRLLSRLGRSLLALGQRLERHSLPRPSPMTYKLEAQRRQ